MGWDERQVRMLEAMGIRVWARGHDAQAHPSAADAADVVTDTAVADRASDGPSVPASAVPRAVVADADQAAVRTAVPRSLRERPAPTARPTVTVARADIESLDWPALREAVAGCTACSLCESRTTTVFGVGHEHAHWMVVGEAPGEQEDREGEPFVGRAGQLLDQMLRAVGLGRRPPAALDIGVATGAAEGSAPGPRADGVARGDAAQQVYIANVLKCRPPQNRNPAPEEIAQCEPFLRRQVALVQPRVILALGRYAVRSLLGSDEPIGRLRGRVHHYQGVPVIVSYHPAYLLRQPADKARAWDDLCLALAVVRGDRAAPAQAQDGQAAPLDGGSSTP